MDGHDFNEAEARASQLGVYYLDTKAKLDEDSEYMDPRRLQYIITLAEYEHFGRAAKALHIAQPALSQNIKAIEREFNVALFNRTPKGANLTDEGMLILPHIKEFLEHSRLLESTFRNITSNAVGELRVAYNRSLPSISKDFFESASKNDDRIQIDVVDVSSTERNYNMVLDNEVDVGIVKLPLEDDWDGVSTQRIGSSVIMVALNEDHPLAASGDVTSHQLKGEKVITWKRRTSPAFYNKLAAHLGERKLQLLESKEPDAVYGLMQVKAGNGIFFIDEDRASTLDVPGIAFRSFNDGRVKVDYGVAWKREGYGSLAIRLFERFLE